MPAFGRELLPIVGAGIDLDGSWNPAAWMIKQLSGVGTQTAKQVRFASGTLQQNRYDACMMILVSCRASNALADDCVATFWLLAS